MSRPVIIAPLCARLAFLAALSFATSVFTPSAQAQVFVAGSSSADVSKISLDGTSFSRFVTGFGSPSGITFGAGGDLYVSDNQENSIIRVNPTTGAKSVFAAVNSPYFSAYRPSTSDLFVTSLTGGTIQRINSLGQRSTFSSGINSPRGLALSPNGDLFVSFANTDIARIDGNTGAFLSSISIAGTDIVSLAFDAVGNLYASDFNNNNIRRITTTGAVSIFATGLSRPTGMAFLPNGNLLVSNEAGSTISQVTPGGSVSQFSNGGNGPIGGGINGPYGIAVAPGVVAVPEANTFALALPALGMVGTVLVRRRKK